MKAKKLKKFFTFRIFTDNFSELDIVGRLFKDGLELFVFDYDSSTDEVGVVVKEENGDYIIGYEMFSAVKEMQFEEITDKKVNDFVKEF